jgi:hypothetical protein
VVVSVVGGLEAAPAEDHPLVAELAVVQVEVPAAVAARVAVPAAARVVAVEDQAVAPAEVVVGLVVVAVVLEVEVEGPAAARVVDQGIAPAIPGLPL